MTRCVATDAGEHRCVLNADHGNDNDNHSWASAEYHLGKLQETVRGYLDGRVDRDFLARALAELDAEIGR